MPLELNDKIKNLERILSNRKKLLIVLHDNPDPDALASGLALGYIAKTVFKTTFKLVYGGIIGRAENIAMVQELKIPLCKAEEIHFNRYSVTALVDTQPHTGNNSLPRNIIPDIVIDHHPRKERKKYAFEVIDTDVGVNSTLLIELLHGLELNISTKLATALVYGISSETQHLGRETIKRDVDAYLSVYPMANLKKLSHIIYPKLSPEYYIFLDKALAQGFYYQNIIGCHIGTVPYPELIPEIADFFVRRKGITLSFCTGIYDNSLFLSMRTTNPKRKIYPLIKKVIGKLGTGGGHSMIGGGRINLLNSPFDNTVDLELSISKRILKYSGLKEEVIWKPLMPIE